MSRPTRNWSICRECGCQHTNPASSSICPECGARERIANQDKKEKSKNYYQTAHGPYMLHEEHRSNANTVWITKDDVELDQSELFSEFIKLTERISELEKDLETEQMIRDLGQQALGAMNGYVDACKWALGIQYDEMVAKNRAFSYVEPLLGYATVLKRNQIRTNQNE